MCFLPYMSYCTKNVYSQFHTYTVTIRYTPLLSTSQHQVFNVHHRIWVFQPFHCEIQTAVMVIAAAVTQRQSSGTHTINILVHTGVACDLSPTQMNLYSYHTIIHNRDWVLEMLVHVCTFSKLVSFFDTSGWIHICSLEPMMATRGLQSITWYTQ